MKILAFVDMHGSHEALEKIKEKSKEADVIVCAGDLSIFENNLEEIFFKLSKLNKTVLVIPGNHESEDDLKQITVFFNNIEDINKKSYVKDDCLFLGYGGGGFSMIDEEFEKISKKFEKEIEKHENKKIILVTHAPPYKTKIDKIMDEHCGNKSLKNFILKVKPDLVISGHLHENAGKEEIVGKTKLINPGPYGKIIKV